jgi:hypothetical protein
VGGGGGGGGWRWRWRWPGLTLRSACARASRCYRPWPSPPARVAPIRVRPRTPRALPCLVPPS